MRRPAAAVAQTVTADVTTTASGMTIGQSPRHEGPTDPADPVGRAIRAAHMSVRIPRLGTAPASELAVEPSPSEPSSPEQVSPPRNGTPAAGHGVELDPDTPAGDDGDPNEHS